MRSRTGCQTCRSRKLKCDENFDSPESKCGQCLKAKRECVRGSGIIFRHQHNASLNDSEEDTLSHFYAYKNTFETGSVWVEIPRQIRFINTLDPYNDEEPTELEGLGSPVEEVDPAFRPPAQATRLTTAFSDASPASNSTQGLDALSAVATGDHFSFGASANRPDVGHPERRPPSSHVGDNPTSLAGTTPSQNPADPTVSPSMSMASSSHHINFILNPSSSASPAGHPTPRSPADARSVLYRAQTASNFERYASMTIQGSLERDHEMAYLLRYAAEGPLLWMDLFDLGTYFSSYVPVRAMKNPLLKYAAVAYAAKALGRVRGKKPTVGGNASRKARTELYPDALSVDWHHKAAEYYDTAVSLLRKALQEDAEGGPTNPEDAQWISGASSAARGSPSTKRRRVSNSHINRNNSDELLAGSAILSVYEFLDVSVPEWSRHLSGAKSLIDIGNLEMMPTLTPSSSGSVPLRQAGISKARRATFWNFARQDMLAAFINESHTRLDPHDLQMWKDAGLLLDEEGFVQSSSTTASGYPEGEAMMKEDTISNALVWLMAKLVNYMASGDEMPRVDGTGFSGINQRTLLEYWNYLRRQFEVWYEGLPLTFKPCARIAPSALPQQIVEDEGDALFPEVWFSISMCASTMQCYYMSQVQLLMNKPHESTQGRTTVFDRFNSYETTLAQCQMYSREIVSISLSRTEASARIHSCQPLFTAGQCLTDPKERRVIIRLLRDIESDTGWATEYRVVQLLNQWGWQ